MYGHECKKDRNAFFKDGEVENLWINVTNIGASETGRGGRGKLPFIYYYEFQRISWLNVKICCKVD